jgi:hypothetical protein
MREPTRDDLCETAGMRRSSLMVVMLTLASCKAQTPDASACEPDHAAAHRQRYAGFCVDARAVTGILELATIGGPATHGKPPEGIEFTLGPIGLEDSAERSVTDAAGIREVVHDAVAVSRAIAEDKGKPAPDQFVLVIDSRASMSWVDRTARALVEVGFTRGHLALASSERTPPPVHPDIYARIVEQIKGERPDEIGLVAAGALERLVGGCTSADSLFRSLQDVPPDQRCTVLMKGLPDAFVECGCPATEPEIMTWVQLTSTGAADAPLQRFVTVEFVSAPDAPPRADGTWGEFVTAHADGLARIEIPPVPPPVPEE